MDGKKNSRQTEYGKSLAAVAVSYTLRVEVGRHLLREFIPKNKSGQNRQKYNYGCKNKLPSVFFNHFHCLLSNL